MKLDDIISQSRFKEILSNRELFAFLVEASCIDENDYELYTPLVECRDSVQDFKENCSDFSGINSYAFNTVTVTSFIKFQTKKGCTRSDMHHLNFNDGGKNVVFIN